MLYLKAGVNGYEDIYNDYAILGTVSKNGKWSDPVYFYADWYETVNKNEDNYREEVVVHYIEGTDLEYISIDTESNTYIDKDGIEKQKYSDSINSEFDICVLEPDWKVCYTFADIHDEDYEFYVNGVPLDLTTEFSENFE